MSKKKTLSPVEEEMAAIRAEINAPKVAENNEVETKDVKQMDEVKNEKPMNEQSESKAETKVSVLPKPMKVPTVVDVKEVPDETLEVYNHIRAGYTKAEIRVMYAGWKQKKFNAIYDRAKEMMKQNISDLEDARADIITKYNDLYRKAYSISNIKACKEILDSLTKVIGLNRDANISAEIITVWKA